MARALIIGASGGIGAAVASALAARGDTVVTLSRSQDGLDITDEASVAAHMGRLDGEFDLVFVATGALVIGGHRPEKAIRQVTGQGMIDQMQVNAIGPMLVLKHVLPRLPKSRPAMFAALSARVGSISDNHLGGWHCYRAAKAALNQLMHGAAIELGRTHPQTTVVCLHPGTVATPFTQAYAASHDRVPPATAAENLLRVMARLGPEHSGGFFDWAGKEIPW